MSGPPDPTATLHADLVRIGFGVAALAAIVAVLGLFDERRAAAQLEQVRQAVCDAGLAASDLALADSLFEPATRGTVDAEALLARLDADLPAERAHLSLYFEAQSTLWTVSPYGDARPTGAESWPFRLARWEEVAWREGCRSGRDGRELLVARTVETPGGRFVVLLATVWRRS